MTYAAFITGAAQLIFLFNFFWSLKKRRERRQESVERHHTGMDYGSPPPSTISAAITPAFIAGHTNLASRDTDKISSRKISHRIKPRY